MKELLKRIACSIQVAGFRERVVIACSPAYDLETFVRMRSERDEWCGANCSGAWGSGDPGDMHRLHYRFESDTDAAMFMLAFDDLTVVHAPKLGPT